MLSQLKELLKSKFVWINVGTALGGIILVMIFATFYLRIYTRHGDSLTVPDLTGITVNELAKHLQGRDLRIKVMDSVYVKDKAPLTILSQTPKAGEKVKENRQIYVTVNSSNPPQVVVPNLIDSSLKDAQIQLEINELVIGQMIHKPHPFKNVVIDMTNKEGKKIKPGDVIYKGSTINLVVGDGLGQTIFELPDFTSTRYSEARISIQMMNLKLGKVHETDLIGDQSTAYVSHQIPSPGTRVAEGDEIELFLSSTKTSPMIPPVPDMNDAYHIPEGVNKNIPIDSNNIEQ